MKIIDKSRIMIPFCDLEAGDLFCNYFDNYYIKTNLLEINGGNAANAVSLRTGALVLFSEKQEVCAVDASLVIDGDDKNDGEKNE